MDKPYRKNVDTLTLSKGGYDGFDLTAREGHIGMRDVHLGGESNLECDVTEDEAKQIYEALVDETLEAYIERIIRLWTSLMMVDCLATSVSNDEIRRFARWCSEKRRYHYERDWDESTD